MARVRIANKIHEMLEVRGLKPADLVPMLDKNLQKSVNG